MERTQYAEPPRIDASLDTLRAGIDVVAAGQATRVTVHVPEAVRLLPAASQLAKRAGVRVELVEPAGPADAEPELMVLPIASSDR